MKTTFSALVAATASLLLLTACASGPGTEPTSTPGVSLAEVNAVPPAGEVTGQGMVMDDAGTVKLCLGAIMESYPPQCHGIPMHGWSWDGVSESETQEALTWGMYAVTGTFDGTAFTLTKQPIMLALYDAIADEDPTGGTAGTTSEARLALIQSEVGEQLGARLLGSAARNGYLWVDVLWDDGTLQDAADETFGDDVVILRSALRDVS